jgi:hypothetical protein
MAPAIVPHISDANVETCSRWLETSSINTLGCYDG